MNDKQFNDQIVEVMFALGRKLKEEMNFDSNTAQLTILQIETLIFISKQETVTMSEVANNFRISLPTTTSLSDKLVKSNLVERLQVANDRRIVKLKLTAEGTKLLAEAMKQRRLKVNKLLSYLTKYEKESLLNIMQNLLNNFQKNEK